ncbi:hypothetical protein BU17DRAFT_63091 [Hysterangium stoloniferum]|nr:hypothetical protein BU17DRAFT_63091 [Hysterangium stoloniferum]
MHMDLEDSEQIGQDLSFDKESWLDSDAPDAAATKDQRSDDNDSRQRSRWSFAQRQIHQKSGHVSEELEYVMRAPWTTSCKLYRPTQESCYKRWPVPLVAQAISNLRMHNLQKELERDQQTCRGLGICDGCNACAEDYESEDWEMADDDDDSPTEFDPMPSPGGSARYNSSLEPKSNLDLPRDDKSAPPSFGDPYLNSFKESKDISELRDSTAPFPFNSESDEPPPSPRPAFRKLTDLPPAADISSHSVRLPCPAEPISTTMHPGSSSASNSLFHPQDSEFAEHPHQHNVQGDKPVFVPGTPSSESARHSETRFTDGSGRRLMDITGNPDLSRHDSGESAPPHTAHGRTETHYDVSHSPHMRSLPSCTPCSPAPDEIPLSPRLDNISDIFDDDDDDDDDDDMEDQDYGIGWNLLMDIDPDFSSVYLRNPSGNEPSALGLHRKYSSPLSLPPATSRWTRPLPRRLKKQPLTPSPSDELTDKSRWKLELLQHRRALTTRGVRYPGFPPSPLGPNWEKYHQPRGAF